jgi:hypothetical protein
MTAFCSSFFSYRHVYVKLKYYGSEGELKLRCLTVVQAPDKPESETPPLLEVQMVLDKSSIRWKPDLAEGDDNGIGVIRMFGGWSKRYLATGDVMRRLDVGEGSYRREIEEDYDVLHAVSQLQEAVLLNKDRCVAFSLEFSTYEDLWTNDMKQSLMMWLEEKSVKNEGIFNVSPWCIDYRTWRTFL